MRCISLLLLHTMGELCLSPVGLSMITRLSVAKVVGLMMGVWFLSSALAHSLAGLIAQATSTDTVAGVVKDPAAQLDSYQNVFSTIGWVGVGIGVILVLLSPILTKMMHLDTLKDDDPVSEAERTFGDAETTKPA